MWNCFPSCILLLKAKNMEPVIRIPRPCHENWDNMLPEEQGRHCRACNSLVMDFSGWSNEQILDYIASRSGAPVCGRMDACQVRQPVPSYTAWAKHIGSSGMSFMHKVAAVIALCFGLLLSNESAAQQMPGKVKKRPQGQITGKMAVQDTDTAARQAPADTLKAMPKIMGMIALPRPQEQPAPEKKPQDRVPEEPRRKP